MYYLANLWGNQFETKKNELLIANEAWTIAKFYKILINESIFINNYNISINL